MAGAVAAYDPIDQARRRRRARVKQIDVAKRLGISQPAISEYETGKESLPWELTADDYEVALAKAIAEKASAA